MIDELCSPEVLQDEEKFLDFVSLMKHAVRLGRAEYGPLSPNTAEGYGAVLADAIKLTSERYEQEEPVTMQTVWLGGSDLILGTTGTGPDSETTARILCALWNQFVAASEDGLAELNAERSEDT